jgi:hypothetical protein
MNNTLRPPQGTHRIPFWLKLAYTAFLAVLIPVYWVNYGPTNFLYFCDVALLLTLVGIWRESPLLISLPAVGILLPQALWCADFAVNLFGGHLAGLTDYMFDPNRSLFLRGLSLFHGWLPFLLFYLVRRLPTSSSRPPVPPWPIPKSHATSTTFSASTTPSRSNCSPLPFIWLLGSVP